MFCRLAVCYCSCPAAPLVSRKSQFAVNKTFSGTLRNTLSGTDKATQRSKVPTPEIGSALDQINTFEFQEVEAGDHDDNDDNDEEEEEEMVRWQHGVRGGGVVDEYEHHGRRRWRRRGEPTAPAPAFYPVHSITYLRRSSLVRVPLNIRRKRSSTSCLM